MTAVAQLLSKGIRLIEEIRVSLGWPEVVARFQHDDGHLLGTTRAGTLKLEIDAQGLRYEVTPPEARADVVQLVARGDVAHSSFAFRAAEDSWGLTEQGYPLRTLVSVSLVDVAPVIQPAYPDATAALRSLARHTDRDVGEIRQLAQERNLATLWGRRARSKREPLLGADARERLLALGPPRGRE